MPLKKWERLPADMQCGELKYYYDILSRKKASLIVKRLFDIAVSFSLILLFLPLMAIIAVGVKLDSRGGALFRQQRVTKYGKTFNIWKFRTMHCPAQSTGPLLTAKDDSRITRAGKVLRGSRLDELPQLFNILFGQMSFVGTRPEVPRFVAEYTREMRATLLLPAGLTSEASIYYREEQQLLTAARDAESVYINDILPAKMRYNLRAIERFRLLREAGIMLKTVFALFCKKETAPKAKDLAPLSCEAECCALPLSGTASGLEYGVSHAEKGLADCVKPCGIADESCITSAAPNAFGARVSDRQSDMLVSLCITAYNEQRFLPMLLDDIGRQTYPRALTEIVFVDGMSTDNTKDIMQQFAETEKGYMRIVVKDNPRRVQACGWNIAIGQSEGDIVIRIDAHARIPDNFIQLNVQNIRAGESISGGARPCVSDGRGAWGKVLLQAENSLFGSSVSAGRRGGSPGYVKTLFHAAYAREVFDEVGGFNEKLLRTEDNELHYRMRAAGYKFYMDPRIKSYQYSRRGFKAMMRQKFGNGYWVGVTAGVCPGCLSLYHFAPLAYVAGIIFTAGLAAVGVWQFAAVMWALYFAIAAINTVCAGIIGGFSILHVLMPPVFAALHAAYGAGTLMGLISMPFKRRKLSRESIPIKPIRKQQAD